MSAMSFSGRELLRFGERHPPRPFRRRALVDVGPWDDGAPRRAVFATAMHTSALGVMLAVARHVLHPTYGETAPSVGVGALQDQAPAALAMWIPAGLVFVVAALALFAAWLGEAARRVARRAR